MTDKIPMSADEYARDQRIRRGVEGSGVGSWDLNLRTLELTWSKAARRLFGFADRDPASYDRFLARLEPDERQKTEQAVRQAETGTR